MGMMAMGPDGTPVMMVPMSMIQGGMMGKGGSKGGKGGKGMGKFADMMGMMGPYGGGKGGAIGGKKGKLVERVKAFQRSGDDSKQVWWDYADGILDGVRDPMKHSADVLEEFCNMNGVP
eukprot:TRINITY_DN396_c0_g1_i1.p2 TRINITY_DN396_c0_g1~~TRINITY_DN396_c0_g1_i1.p2  ORF type:complete len:119 (+),score=48.51 TRINITY_DN396_c0_g1_i1:2-358(+)